MIECCTCRDAGRGFLETAWPDEVPSGQGHRRTRSADWQHRGRQALYAYLFAKQDRANILPDELLKFRKLAAAYARMTVSEVNIELRNGDLLEICHDE